MGVYIVLHQEAEKTFSECAELKSFVTVRCTIGLERQAKRASQRVNSFHGQKANKHDYARHKSPNQPSNVQPHKNTDRPDNKFRISSWPKSLFQTLLFPKGA